MNYLIALLCTSVSLPAFSQAVASFRGDAQHSGIYQQVGVPRLHGIKWKFKTGAAVISTPAAIDGTAHFGSNDHYLYAVNLADGAQRWKFESGSRVTSSPAVYNGRVDLVLGVLKMLSIGAVLSSPVIERDVIYFGSTDGNVYAIS